MVILPLLNDPSISLPLSFIFCNSNFIILFSSLSFSTMSAFYAISFSFKFSSLSVNSCFYMSSPAPFLLKLSTSLRFCTSFCNF